MTPWYLKFALLSNSEKRNDDSRSRISIQKYTTKGKSFINTGNVLLAWISFSTPSLFISQLNELLTAHISSVPAASPVTLVSANCRQMRVSLPGEEGGEGRELEEGDERHQGSAENWQRWWVPGWARRCFWAKSCSFSVLCALCEPFCTRLFVNPASPSASARLESIVSTARLWNSAVGFIFWTRHISLSFNSQTQPLFWRPEVSLSSCA